MNGSHPLSPSVAPSLDEFALRAEAAYATLPQELVRCVQGVVIRVDDFPSAEIEQDLDLESPFDLLGLYHGVAMGDKSLSDTPSDVDMIFLYRRPILDYWCESGEDLQALIAHVLIHEIGHHFGLSDDDMDRIENTLDTSNP